MRRICARRAHSWQPAHIAHLFFSWHVGYSWLFVRLALPPVAVKAAEGGLRRAPRYLRTTNGGLTTYAFVLLRALRSLEGRGAGQKRRKAMGPPDDKGRYPSLIAGGCGRLERTSGTAGRSRPFGGQYALILYAASMGPRSLKRGKPRRVTHPPFRCCAKMAGFQDERRRAPAVVIDI